MCSRGAQQFEAQCNQRPGPKRSRPSTMACPRFPRSQQGFGFQASPAVNLSRMGAISLVTPRAPNVQAPRLAWSS